LGAEPRPPHLAAHSLNRGEGALALSISGQLLPPECPTHDRQLPAAV